MGRIDQPDVIRKKQAKGANVTVYPTGHQGGWQGGGGGGTTQYVSCGHAGEKVVYTHSGGTKMLYAASSSGLKERSGAWDLIIDLAHVVRVSRGKFVESVGKWTGLNKYVKQVSPIPSDHLVLDWPDMQAAPTTLDFWLTLWPMLPEKTVICCYGGHGRTGTCLASLMIADGVDYYSAVENVRTDHCKKAIETVGQELYLHSLYVEYLKRAMIMAEEQKLTGDLTDLVKDMQYALAHLPNAWSSFGEEKQSSTEKVKFAGGAAGPVNPTQAVGGTTGRASNAPSSHPSTAIVPAGFKPAVLDPELRGYKHVGGRDYYYTCVKPHCADINCTNPHHQGWVEYNSGYGAGV